MLSKQKFRLERDMLEPLTKALPSVLQILSRQEVRLLREPNVGMIIPDLLVGVAGRRAQRERPQSTHIEAHVLAFLEASTGATALHLTESLYLQSDTLQRALRRLSQSRIIRKATGENWELVPAFRCRCFQIIAIEAKLTRWRNALEQARRYLAFANRAYVVLDGNRVRDTAEIRSAFRGTGIGLMFQTGIELRVAIGATHGKPSSPERVHAIDKLFSKESGRAKPSRSIAVSMS